MAKFDIDAALQSAETDGPTRFRMPDAPTAPAESTGMRIGRHMSGPMRGYITAMQGPTLGFLDEISGGASGAAELLMTGDFGKANQAYRHSRDVIRGMEAEYQREYPTAAAFTKTMAAMPVYMSAPIPSLPRLGTGLGANIARAAIPAAGMAAVQAVGESGNADPVGLFVDALSGAIIGAVTTGATMGITAAGRGVLRAAPGVAGAVGAGGKAEQAIREQAAEELAKNIARDVKPGTVFDPATKVATGQVTAGGKPVMRPAVSSPVEQAAARVGKLGERGMILDLPGQNVRQLADTLYTLPGQTKNRILDEKLARRATSADRLIRAADDAIAAGDMLGRKILKQGKLPPTPKLAPTLDALNANRRALAGPMYKQLESIEVVVDEPTARAIQAMRSLGALRSAERMATAERRAFTLSGDIKAGDRVSMSDLDLAKRGLDHLIDTQTDKVTGKISPEGVTLNGLLNDFKGYLDDVTIDPETGESLYRAARSAYAGQSALINAANLGRKALDADKSGKIADEIAGLGDSEIEAFRVGVLQAIRDKAGSKSGRTQLLSFWENPNVGDKLKAAFGGNFKQLAAALMREERLKGIQAIGAGSQTGARLAGMDDLGQSVEDVASAVASAKAGAPVGFLGGLSSLYNRTRMPEAVRDELGRMITMRGPEAQRQLLTLADLVREAQMRRAAVNAGFGGAAGGTIVRGTTPSGDQ